MQHKPEPLIRFDRKHRLLLVCLAALFVTALSFRLHGYSVSHWKNYFPDTEKSEILLGNERAIRSDDWGVEIPLILAQSSHVPPYPLLNRNIGDGLNMLVFSKMPVKHMIAIFRPTVWGFFIGKDVGLSWMWWTLVLGSFYVYFLLLLLISDNHFFLSLLGSLFLLFSPYFQFWSFHGHEIPLFMGVSAISCLHLAYGRTGRRIMTHALILAWGLSCFTLHYMYPPFQIACGYLLISFIAGFVIHDYDKAVLFDHAGYKIFGFGLCLAVFLLAVLVFYDATKDALAVLARTDYPGNRLSLGGNYSLYAFFRENYFTSFLGALKGRVGGPATNICESALFWFFFPVIAVALIWERASRAEKIDRFSIGLLLYMTLMSLYLLIGFPPALARFTLFHWMPGPRALLGLGIANAILLVRFLSYGPGLGYRQGAVLCIVWTIILLIVGGRLADHLNTVSTWEILLFGLLNGLVAFHIIVRKGWMTMAILSAVSIVITAWFNPLVSGGTAFLYENPLSRAILEVDRGEEGETSWAAYGRGSWVMGNLIRVLGVRSVSGTHPCPQLRLWERLDPEHHFMTQYNRFAHSEFIPPDDGNRHFSNPLPDLLVINADPSVLYREWGVTHILALGRDSRYYDRHAALTRLFTLADKRIYRIAPHRADIKNRVPSSDPDPGF